MSGGSPIWNEADLDKTTVPAVVVHHVIVEALKKLDTELWPRDGRMPPRGEMLSFVENLRYEIYRRAKLHVTPPKNPAKKPPPEVQDSRAEYYARKSGRPPSP